MPKGFSVFFYEEGLALLDGGMFGSVRCFSELEKWSLKMTAAVEERKAQSDSTF